MDKQYQAVADTAPFRAQVSRQALDPSNLGLRLLQPAFKNIPRGSLRLRFADGTEHCLSGRDSTGPSASIHIHSSKAFLKLLFGGDVEFADAYALGQWSTPDLGALLRFALENEQALGKQLSGNAAIRLLNRLLHLLRNNSRSGSRRNISFHYDLGNDFYQQWLDPSMSYSSALFEHPQQDLQQAQENKYRRIRELTGTGCGDRILEIGCGWGGFMEHAGRRGLQIHGVTLSREQLAYANQRMRAEGLGYQANATLTDYRDTIGQYDGIVSIEMLEAVGEAHWPQYFQTLFQRLKPGAAAVIQVITIEEERFGAYRSKTDFIQKYIFPGGMLPTPEILKNQCEQAGLVQDHAQSFGLDYAETLRLWRQSFLSAWPTISQQGFDLRFRRLWEYYLHYCEAGFRHGSIDVGIYRFRRPE